MRYDMYDPDAQPPGAKWSKRLGKWRYPVMRGFHWDRQGIHVVMGLVVPFLVIGSFIPAAIITAVFVAYEIVEANIIGDDAYIDIGAYLGGLMAGYGILHWGPRVWDAMPFS